MNNIDLHALNLQSKWPKLAKLEQDRRDFQRRHQKAAQQVNVLANHAARARNADIEAAASAVRQGRKPPEFTHEAKAKQDLEDATRERDVLAGVVQRIEEEFGEFLAKHQRELFGDVLQARHAVADSLAEHARACLADYSRHEDLGRVVKDLTPTESFVEGAPAQKLTTSIIGINLSPQSSAPARGNVEGILSYLAGLAPEDHEGDDAAA